jgi:acetyl esterase/lipase
MPVHPAIAARFHHLDGIRSFREAFTDPAQRQQIDRFTSWTPAQPPPTVQVRTEAVDGPHGPVPVRVYLPPESDTERPGPVLQRPCLVWMHGGGFVGGDLDMQEADWTAREVCDRGRAVVVSVDYRLAVAGVSYPVPLDDVVAAMQWTRAQAVNLAIDVDRICLGGASAGGNLAAGAALHLRDFDRWQPAALALVYPVLHAVLPAPSPALLQVMATIPEPLRLRPADALHLATNYLGGPASSADGYAMPGQAHLENLCSTLILNAEFDDLRPSGEAFTASLARAGVDVQQVTVPGMMHGFLNLPTEIPAVGRTLDAICGLVTSRPNRTESNHTSPDHVGQPCTPIG